MSNLLLANKGPPRAAPRRASKRKGLRPIGADARKPCAISHRLPGDLYRRVRRRGASGYRGAPRTGGRRGSRLCRILRPPQDAPTANIVELGACRKDNLRPCICAMPATSAPRPGDPPQRCRACGRHSGSGRLGPRSLRSQLLPRAFSQRPGGTIDLDNPAFWEWFKQDYREMLDLLPRPLAASVTTVRRRNPEAASGTITRRLTSPRPTGVSRALKTRSKPPRLRREVAPIREPSTQSAARSQVAWNSFIASTSAREKTGAPYHSKRSSSTQSSHWQITSDGTYAIGTFASYSRCCSNDEASSRYSIIRLRIRWPITCSVTISLLAIQ